MSYVVQYGLLPDLCAARLHFLSVPTGSLDSRIRRHSSSCFLYDNKSQLSCIHRHMAQHAKAALSNRFVDVLAEELRLDELPHEGPLLWANDSMNESFRSRLTRSSFCTSRDGVLGQVRSQPRQVAAHRLRAQA